MYLCREAARVSRKKSMTSYRGIAEGVMIEEGEVNSRQKHMISHHGLLRARSCDG